MKYPSILLGAVQSCMKRQSVVKALITSPSVDRDVNFKSSAHTEISIKFIPSVKGLMEIIIEIPTLGCNFVLTFRLYKITCTCKSALVLLSKVLHVHVHICSWHSRCSKVHALT